MLAITYIHGRKRTTVFADEDDLAILKAAAARRGIAEAELLRDAIHLVAMADQSWDEPFFSHTYRADPAWSGPRIADAVWDERAEEYERTKGRAR